MHRAVGEKYPAQAVSLQPVAVEENETLPRLAAELQPLTHLIEILTVGRGGNRTQHFIAGQQFALAVVHQRQIDRSGDVGTGKSECHQQQGDDQQTAAGQIPAHSARMWRIGGRRCRRRRDGFNSSLGWISTLGKRRPGIEQFNAQILIQLQHAARYSDDNVIDIVVAEGFTQHAQVLIEVAVGRG